MITLFSGIPGSGKSYKMVVELSRVKDKFFVVHNIDGLQEGFLGEYGFDFSVYCPSEISILTGEKKEKVEYSDFFSKEYQEALCEKIREKYNRPVLVIIDDTQEILYGMSKSIRIWLSYHRHLGQDIWMVAHRASNISSVYRSFIEVEFRAKSGSIIGLPGFFIYNRILGGQRAGYIKERKRKSIFAVYNSQSVDVERKRKTPMLIPLVIMAVAVGLGGFFWIPAKFMKKTPVKIAEKNQLKTVSSVSQAGVVIPEVVVPGGNGMMSGSVSQAGVVIPEVVLKVVVDMSEKFAFIGNFNGSAVIENRSSGEQMTMNRAPGRLMLISADGLNSCTVISGDSGKQMTFYNSGRFAGVSGRGTSRDTPANGESVFSSMKH